MTGWTAEQLRTLHGAQLVAITPGGGSTPRTIGVVETGGRVFVRSYRGAEGVWYRRVLASGTARLDPRSAPPIDVAATPAPEADDEVDAAFVAKYGRREGGTMNVPHVRATTLELRPL